MKKIEMALRKAAGRAIFLVDGCPPEELREIHEAQQELTEIKQLLKEIEWCASSYDPGYCPICGFDNIDGHEPDCRLAKYIKE